MINKEQLRAKARSSRSFNNPGLKSGVIDNETFADFSPKYVLLHNFFILHHSHIFKHFDFFWVIPYTSVMK